jgi:hypothetical protein
MGDATDSGHWSLESIATHVAQEMSDEAHPAERPTRRDLPRLQSRGRSLEADPSSSLQRPVVVPVLSAEEVDEVVADLSQESRGDAEVQTVRARPK